MYGLQIAFKDLNIIQGIWRSPWVGQKHFRDFFGNPAAMKVVRNTIEISLLRIAFGFPAPIILALLLNEVKDGFFKRFTQTVSYLPHFISWIIISAIFHAMLSPSGGVVNTIIKAFGGRPIYFMASPQWFRPVLIFSAIWKEVGWGAVIYLAALSGVDLTLYEAAIVDGATRLQRMRYISLPSITPVVTIVLILSMGGILNAGFDQIFNMYNVRVYDVADIIDTYVYRAGLVSMQYSFSAAVGLFKSIDHVMNHLNVIALASRVSEERQGLW